MLLIGALWVGACASAVTAPISQTNQIRTPAGKVADEGGGGDLRGAQGDCGTGVWADQAGAGIPAVFLAGLGEGEGGVGLGMSDAQHSEVTPTLL